MRLNASHPASNKPAGPAARKSWYARFVHVIVNSNIGNVDHASVSRTVDLRRPMQRARQFTE